MTRRLRSIFAPASGVSVPVVCGALAAGIGAGVASFQAGAVWYLAVLSGVGIALGFIAAPARRAGRRDE